MKISRRQFVAALSVAVLTGSLRRCDNDEREPLPAEATPVGELSTSYVAVRPDIMVYRHGSNPKWFRMLERPEAHSFDFWLLEMMGALVEIRSQHPIERLVVATDSDQWRLTPASWALAWDQTVDELLCTLSRQLPRLEIAMNYQDPVGPQTWVVPQRERGSSDLPLLLPQKLPPVSRHDREQIRAVTDLAIAPDLAANA